MSPRIWVFPVLTVGHVPNFFFSSSGQVSPKWSKLDDVIDEQPLMAGWCYWWAILIWGVMKYFSMNLFVNQFETINTSLIFTGRLR